MLLSNIHTHTRFSDGRDSAEDMVRAAIERGFTSLGFSDHGFAPHDDAAMRAEVEAEYRAEILRLKKAYAGQIEIALGYEHDFSAAGADLSPYDYVIESVHFFRKDGCFVPIDYSPECFDGAVHALYRGDYYAMAEDYFAEVCRSFLQSDAEVIGHIGLITKFNEGNCRFDMEDDRYLFPATEALRCAVDRGRIIEVNTGAMSRGYRSAPYPGMALLGVLRALGGRITITSDCHRAEWIDFGFDRALQMVRACGFGEVWCWIDGGFRAVDISTLG